MTPSLTPLGPLQARAGDATAAMGEAERLRADANSDRDSAASTCKKTIDGCVDDDLKNQGGFFGWVKHTFKKIAPVLAAVAAVVGIAALFIPGLNLLALGLAVACLVVDSANYFAFHQGDLLTVALDLVGVAAFAGALKAARAGRAAQNATATTRANQATRTSTTINRTTNANKLKGIARTRVGMTRGEIRAAARNGNLRQVVRTRQAAITAEATETATRTGRQLDQAARPFRTMVRDSRQLMRDPSRQVRPNALMQAGQDQLQLARAERAYAASTATGAVTSVLSAPPADAHVASAVGAAQEVVTGAPIDDRMADVGGRVRPTAPPGR